jgi:ribosomal subunit interface protein
MKITVTGHQVSVSVAERAQIRKKVSRLHRILNDAAVSAQVVVLRDGPLAACELTLHARGDHMLHAKGRGSRASVAVGLAVDKVSAQAQKLSDRWKTRRKGSGA